MFNSLLYFCSPGVFGHPFSCWPTCFLTTGYCAQMCNPCFTSPCLCCWTLKPGLAARGSIPSRRSHSTCKHKWLWQSVTPAGPSIQFFICSVPSMIWVASPCCFTSPAQQAQAQVYASLCPISQDIYVVVFKFLGGQKSSWGIWVYKYTIFTVIFLLVYLSLSSNLSSKNKIKLSIQRY